MTLENEETGFKTDLPISRNGIMPLTYYKNIHDFNNIKAVLDYYSDLNKLEKIDANREAQESIVDIEKVIND